MVKTVLLSVYSQDSASPGSYVPSLDTRMSGS
jgi:hypothetical protein